MARIGRLNVMIEEEVKDKFHAIARQFGLTDSALGAWLVGQYVHQQSAVAPMQEELTKKVMEVVEAQMKGMIDLVAGGDLGEVKEATDNNIGITSSGEGVPG